MSLNELNDYPIFNAIEISSISQNIKTQLQKNKQEIETLMLNINEYSWDNFILYIENLDNELSKMWSVVSHLNHVVNSEELRKEHDKCLPLLSEYGTWMSQNKRLFQIFTSIYEQGNYDQDNLAQKKYLENALKDFKLSGIDLLDEEQKKYQEIVKELSTLSSQFANNVLDSTNAWEKHITEETQLVGLPQFALDLLAQNAKQRDKTDWLLTLDAPCYTAIMMYADDPKLRKEVYHAYCTRGSKENECFVEYDNSAVMDRILFLRNELAHLLGFQNYAEKSLATKMAETPQMVLDFLMNLAEQSYEKAMEEFSSLEKFARKHYDKSKLEAWDIAYFSEKQKQELYQISDEKLKPYFPENKVVQGLFDIVEKLFSVTIKEDKTVPTWHQDVKFYHILNEENGIQAGFYFDLYARKNKQGGAWMADYQSRFLMDNKEQMPIAFLTCNFNPPIGDKPALFTHDEVNTLFHEFGHGLHHMLTKVNILGVSGINGVEWDAVELPSQFLENWCWDKEALRLISGHYQTGETLPDDLMNNMLKTKNFHSAMMLLRQLEFSLFDFKLHLEYQSDKPDFIQSVLDDVRRNVAVFFPPSFNRFQNSFSHIFAGGYAAGYYSYKWAEVLSADAFSRFEEEGVFNSEVGHAFKKAILEKGGSQKAMDLFIEFRGRKPSITPLLKHSGILDDEYV